MYLRPGRNPMRTLVLLRHGESEWNAAGLFTAYRSRSALAKTFESSVPVIVTRSSSHD